MTTPTIPFYPVTHDDGTSIVSALNNITSARRMPIVVADAFNTLQSYDVGDYVIYENNMYRFTSAHSASAWDSTQVVRVTVGEELEDLSENQDSINSSLSAIDNSLAIVSDGDTHIAISSGQYVYVKNHTTLTEGLYTANSAIGQNVALTTSNLTSVISNGGGFNKINSNIATINSNITTINNKMAYTTGSATRNTTYVSSGSCNWKKQRCGDRYIVTVTWDFSVKGSPRTENIATFFTNLPSPISGMVCVSRGYSSDLPGLGILMFEGGNMKPWYCGTASDHWYGGVTYLS